ncbi:MAG TPA: hypothetical protein P5277_02870 [Candidatus Paceibacterota bacterium]|nr:hypothetical protein [Candidatus Paceibacterota bacterium]
MPEDKRTYPKPSEEFLRTIITRSSILIDCEFCNRTHFVNSSKEDFDEGELEELLQLAKTNPDKYIYHDDLVEWGYLNRKQYVADCPCNSGYPYEQLFWNSREMISQYFKVRASKQLAQAQRDFKLTEELPKL